MSKQSDIREGIARLVHHWHIGDSERWEDNDEEHWQGPKRREYYEAADALLPYLYSQIEDMANDGDSVGEILKALREEA